MLVVFLTSCENNRKDVASSAEISQVNDTNYRYDDFYLSYLIKEQDNKNEQYKLKLALLDDKGLVTYETDIFDTINTGTPSIDSVNLKNISWYKNGTRIEFYNIEDTTYSIQLQVIDFDSEIVLYASNKLMTEINRIHPDDTKIDNFILTDIQNNEHELVKILEDKEYVFIFYFSTWCGWSKRSFPMVNYIDSVYNKKVKTFAIEGTMRGKLNEDELNRVIVKYNVAFPICSIKDNKPASDIIHPNVNSLPLFELINKDRKIVCSQKGYSEDLPDSISYYINTN